MNNDGLEKFSKVSTNIYPNKSWWIFLPILGYTYHELYNVQGMFVRDENYPNLNNHLFLLLKNVDNNEFFDRYLTFFRTKKNYLSEYSPLKGYKIIIFKVPNRIQLDYEKFLRGEYSKINDKYKKHILSFFDVNINEKGWKHIPMILYKNKEYKKALEKELDVVIPEDQELASIIDIKKETFSLDKITS